ncbi:hypothetical protein EVAR_13274_1 [Eumeta japonica]|uniref:Uncharacterized protein n=1 Tax=Eumeta variegata TaxID=151549 RepID=A0A4C1YLE5_EUMVA|nr:hypothetical protein EVAR_13274_1 [Eumeta japonica]
MVRNYKKKGTRSGEVDEQAMLKLLVYHSNPVTIPNEITGGEELVIAGDELPTVSAELGDVPARTPPTLSRNVSPSLLSQHFASTVIDFDNPAPSTSKVLKTPEMRRPFPKVQKCTQTKKGYHRKPSRVGSRSSCPAGSGLRRPGGVRELRLMT